jgi:hypothetical protein
MNLNHVFEKSWHRSIKIAQSIVFLSLLIGAHQPLMFNDSGNPFFAIITFGTFFYLHSDGNVFKLDLCNLYFSTLFIFKMW